MPTNWSQEKYHCLIIGGTGSRAISARPVQIIHAKATLQVNRPLTNRLESGPLPTFGDNKWWMQLVGWDLMIAGLAGVMIYFLLKLASFGVLGSAVTVAAILAAVGLGHYLLLDALALARLSQESGRHSRV